MTSWWPYEIARHLHQHVEVLAAVEGRVLEDVAGAPEGARRAVDVEEALGAVVEPRDRDARLAFAERLAAMPAARRALLVDVGEDVVDVGRVVSLDAAHALDPARSRVLVDGRKSCVRPWADLRIRRDGCGRSSSITQREEGGQVAPTALGREASLRGRHDDDGSQFSLLPLTHTPRARRRETWPATRPVLSHAVTVTGLLLAGSLMQAARRGRGRAPHARRRALPPGLALARDRHAGQRRGLAAAARRQRVGDAAEAAPAAARRRASARHRHGRVAAGPRWTRSWPKRVKVCGRFSSEVQQHGATKKERACPPPPPGRALPVRAEAGVRAGAAPIR